MNLNLEYISKFQNFHVNILSVYVSDAPKNKYLQLSSNCPYLQEILQLV